MEEAGGPVGCAEKPLIVSCSRHTRPLPGRTTTESARVVSWRRFATLAFALAALFRAAAGARGRRRCTLAWRDERHRAQRPRARSLPRGNDPRESESVPLGGTPRLGGVPPPVAGLCRLGGVADDEAEPGRVGVALIARHEEVLRARRRQGDQQARLIAVHDVAVRDVLGKRRVGTGLHVDALVADDRGDRTGDDVEGLVLARVGVDRRLAAGARSQLDDGPVTAGLLADELDLGARAVAVGHGTSGAGAGQDGIVQGHDFSPSWWGRRAGCMAAR